MVTIQLGWKSALGWNSYKNIINFAMEETMKKVKIKVVNKAMSLPKLAATGQCCPAANGMAPAN